MNIFSGTQVPAWLANAARPVQPEAAGNLVGTALGGGLNAIADKTSFREGVATGRLNQQDPMWVLKAKQAEATTAGTRTLAAARWLEADKKVQESEWLNSSLERIQGWTPDQPIPPGLDPKVAAYAIKERTAKVNADLKTKDLERKVIEANTKADAAHQRAVTQQEQFNRTLASREEQFNQKIVANERLDGIKARYATELEQLRQQGYKDRMGKVLTREEYINRHQKTVTDMILGDLTPEERVGAAVKLLSDQYDNISKTEPTNSVRVLSITPAP